MMRTFTVWWSVLLLTLAVTDAQQHAAAKCVDGDGSSVECRISNLQSFSSADLRAASAAKRLSVSCSSAFFSESVLRTNHLGSMPNLEELTVDHCKVHRLPERAFGGMVNLRRLTLRSRNAEWSPSMMDLSFNSLSDLPELQQLSMPSNNIWSLDRRLLCGLTKLTGLNLSHNHLLSVADVGLSSGAGVDDGCKSAVTVLDLAENFITALHRSELAQASNLQVLNLSANRISIVGDGAFVGLGALVELNLADNQLAALPQDLFNGSQALQKLFLQNNSLTLLPPRTFSGLSGLAVLNVSRNAISSHLLSADSFAGLANLQVLDLSHNQLTSVDNETFSALPQLRILHLEHNRLSALAPAGFSRMAGLKILVLSGNRLVGLEESVFDGLSELTSLALDRNELTSLPDRLFDGTQALEDLSADNNRLSEIPRAVSKLVQLRTLDMGENSIGEVRSSDLRSLTNLHGLRLSGNNLTLLSRSALANLTRLHVLNVAHNKLAKIEQGALDRLQELRALRLDNNRLSDINGAVSALSKLQWFNVSSNQLQWFDYAFVPASLEWLDLHDNAIDALGNYYALDSGFSLRMLDASRNKIRRLDRLSLPSSAVETILLADNAIADVDPRFFEGKLNLTTVDLANNALAKLVPEAILNVAAGKEEQAKARVEFHLSGNPLRCDCHMDWLLQTSSSSQLARVADLDRVTCQPVTGRNNSGAVAVVSARPDHFLCEYRTHCFDQCQCCDFFACDCRMQCPEGCSCFHDSAWSANVIQCSDRSHKDVPLLIPMDSTAIYLDGNNLTDVDTQSFIGRRRVTSLFLNASQITSVSRQTFSGLSSLEVLHLEDNTLKEVGFSRELDPLVSLRELYLNNNELVRIAAHAFDSLTSLLVLRLDGNLLTTFPAWGLFKSNPLLSALYLSENTWSCECDFLTPFSAFLVATEDSVPDANSLRCVAEGLQVRNIDYFAMDCTQSSSALMRKEGAAEDETEPDATFVPVLVSAVLVAIIVVAGFMIACVFRNRIKTWLYNKSSEIYESRSGASSIHSVMSGSGSCYAQNKLFDVYITYSLKDASFVSDTLAPSLETTSSSGSQPPSAASYKLCLHQRDFPPTASLFDTVSVATESSARVLLVLSSAYLECEWPHVRLPLRTALKGDSNKLVILMLEDFAEERLRPHAELRSAARVRFGAPGWLQKLRFFLPEPAFLTFQRNVTLRTLQPALSKSTSLVQVDAVSGVWTYALGNSASVNGSAATQTTSDEMARYHLRPAPSIISSLYSHHTYQSIPEVHQQQQHIYHTLEPGLLLPHHPDQPPQPTVYINRNLDVVVKATAAGATPPPSSSPTTSSTSSSSSTECHHIHSHSGLSSQQLLSSSSSSSSTSSGNCCQDEYIV